MEVDAATQRGGALMADGQVLYGSHSGPGPPFCRRAPPSSRPHVLGAWRHLAFGELCDGYITLEVRYLQASTCVGSDGSGDECLPPRHERLSYRAQHV